MGVPGRTTLHVDEFVEQLLSQERVCGLILPRLPRRCVLEDKNGLPIRESVLGEEVDEEVAKKAEEEKEKEKKKAEERKKKLEEKRLLEEKNVVCSC